jgi:hypothetical protein
MTIWSELRLEPERMRLSEFPASRGESIGASAEETFEEFPTLQAVKVRELQDARGEREDLGSMIERVQGGEDLGEVAYGKRPEIPQTDVAEARERVKREGLDLKLPETGTIATPALDIMLDRAKTRRQREQVLSRGPQDWTQTALNAGTSFLVGAVDPLNVASAFIPVVGELRYGKMLADAGFSATRRAVVAAEVGAASGAVGVAALQPLDAYSRTLEGQDWHFAHSLQNIAFGAGLGAILMGAGRAVGDVRRARADRPMYPFDVGEILDDHPAWADLRNTPEFKPLRARVSETPDLPEQFPGFTPEVRARIGLTEADPVPTPEVATIMDLPPRAQEDAMRVAVAALVNGEPVRAGEMLDAAAAGDPRIAESFEVWHGSPHTFDAFSLDKIGTGEGAQAYGKGLYFAESEDVAASYRDTLAPGRSLLPPEVEAMQGEARRSFMSQVASKREPADAAKWAQYGATELRAVGVGRLAELITQVREAQRGQMYRTRIRANRDAFLDWDGPVPMDSPARNRLRELGEMGMEAHEFGVDRNFAKEAILAAKNENLTGEGLYRSMIKAIEAARPKLKEAGNERALFGDLSSMASDELRQLGIPGLRYLDQGSRGVGEGTRNFVVFDDALTEIIERNGQPVQRRTAEPQQAWRDLSRETPPDPEVIAAAEAVAKMEPPPSTVDAPVAKPKPVKAATPEPEDNVIHVGPKAVRGPRARPQETWSLLEYIASRGGIDPADPLVGDIRSMIGTSNKFIPGFGHLIRKGGMRLDRAREAAVEAGYLVDQGNLTGRQADTTISTLIDAMDGEVRGTKVYREGVDISQLPAEQKRVAEANRASLERAIDQGLAEVEVDAASMPDKTYKRVLEIMEREGESDPVAAWERAVMEEYQDGAEAGQHQRIAAEIPGWDVPNDAGTAPRAGGTAARGGERGTGDAGGTAGEGNRAPGSESAKAAVEAEQRIAELYDAELTAGYIDFDRSAALVKSLDRIEQDNTARAAVVREGAACLLAGFGTAAL